MLSIPMTLSACAQSGVQTGWPPFWNKCFNIVVSILNKSYIKKTDDINRLNRARSHTDGDRGKKFTSQEVKHVLPHYHDQIKFIRVVIIVNKS